MRTEIRFRDGISTPLIRLLVLAAVAAVAVVAITSLLPKSDAGAAPTVSPSLPADLARAGFHAAPADVHPNITADAALAAAARNRPDLEEVRSRPGVTRDVYLVVSDELPARSAIWLIRYAGIEYHAPAPSSTTGEGKGNVYTVSYVLVDISSAEVFDIQFWK